MGIEKSDEDIQVTSSHIILFSDDRLPFI